MTDEVERIQLARLHDEIKNLGLVEIEGVPQAVSQFGITYKTWFLGWKQSEGSGAMEDGLPKMAQHVDSLASAVNHAIRDFTVAAAGAVPARAVVWRVRPYWQRQEPGCPRHYGLRFRCHFLTKVPAELAS